MDNSWGIQITICSNLCFLISLFSFVVKMRKMKRACGCGLAYDLLGRQRSVAFKQLPLAEWLITLEAAFKRPSATSNRISN